MPTNLTIGLWAPSFNEKDAIPPTIYIDDQLIQILDENEQFIAQFTYEELKGIMAIMAAEQEKKHFFIKNISSKN